MTIRFLDSRNGEISNCIRGMFCKTKEIYCIVAFWGHGADKIFDGLSKKLKRNTKIVCNLTMGGTNPKTIEELMSQEFDVKHSPNLHSKVYWTEKGVVVGSANASANGLSLQGSEQEGWLEAAIFTDQSETLKRTMSYVKKMWCESREITPQDLQMARRKWRSRRPFPPQNDNMNFVEALESGVFTDRTGDVYIVIDKEYAEGYRDDIQNQANEMQGVYLDLGNKKLDAWVDWPEIPRQAYTLSYFCGPRNGISFCGLWYTLSEQFDRDGLNEGTEYQFAYRARLSEIGITGRQRDQLTRLVRYIVVDNIEQLQQANEEMGLYDWEHGYCIRVEHLLQPPFEEIVDQFLEKDMR